MSYLTWPYRYYACIPLKPKTRFKDQGHLKLKLTKLTVTQCQGDIKVK